MPGPACSTSMGEERAAETNDQPSVTVSRALKPYFMSEYAAGSGEYLKAFVVDENPDQVRLRFPACKETKNKEEVVWISRCSSRIWRGSNAKDAWSKVASGEGAWRPKKRKGTLSRLSRKKSAKLENGLRRASTTEQAEEMQDCLEGSAECPDRGDTNMATSQEVVVLHDLPSDPLAAWFYKNDEGSSEIGMSDPNQTSSNAGGEAQMHGNKAKLPGKSHNTGRALERDDSAMEEALSHSMPSQSVSRPSTAKPSAVIQSKPLASSAVAAIVVKAYNC